MLQQQIIAYVNPASGDGLGKKIKHILSSQHIEVIDRLTLQQLIQTAATHLLICGGDGTVHHVIDYLVKHNLLNKFILILKPIGTGNDLARSLGFTHTSIVKNLAQLVNCPKISLPLWRLSRLTPTSQHDYFFINYASFGMDAIVQRQVNKWRKLLPKKRFSTFLVYTLAFFHHLFKKLPKDMQMFSDDLTIKNERPYCNIILANINSYAGGSRVGNKETLTQAKLNFFAIKHFWNYLTLLITRFSWKTAHPLHAIQHFTLRGHNICIQVDGEVLPSTKELTEVTIELAGYLPFIRLVE